MPSATAAPAVQVDTGNGCHLEAEAAGCGIEIGETALPLRPEV